MFKLLDKHHDRKAFDCGNAEINLYLHTMANQHAKKGLSKTHILANDGNIQAFYTLTASSFDNSEKSIGGYPHTIPIVTIGRIGVDKHHQKQGLSKLAIAHALQMIKQSSREIGIAFVMLDAKNEALAHYYERLGFIRIHGGLKLAYPVSQI